jgi:uncharacterized lipoprotein YddW (UPF0748 family)
MKKLPVALFLGVFILVTISGCAVLKPGGGDKSVQLPRADREFRGVWVATVDNIDWPTKPGLSTDDQKKEVLAILDSAVSIGLNAIVFQVRPQCDAMYPSSLEPWSYYLTGVQGKAPYPYYDPLQFWVEESHKRGLELHTWFNPYRAHTPRGGEVTDSSIVKKKPGLAKATGRGTYWLDPAEQETQDHSYAVVMDVVKRYDIDGVHFDDYFYPYGGENFPDDDSWNKYTASGGSLSKEDWRRTAVNNFIERVYKGIKTERPNVKFGLSPFGIWRPGYPASISGFDQYAGLYADARLWLNKGWVDYWTPQLYWPINQIPQSFPVLLGWWAKENTQGRNLWPGMIIGRMNNEKGVDEICNQIMIARGFVPDGPGHVHFSMKAFMRDSCMLSAGLKAGPYQRPALVPPSPWLDNIAPESPVTKVETVNDTIRLSWSHPQIDDVFRWVVYIQYGQNWTYTILNHGDNSKSIAASRIVKIIPRGRRPAQEARDTTEVVTAVAVSAVDRMGNESTFTIQTIAPGPVAAIKP